MNAHASGATRRLDRGVDDDLCLFRDSNEIGDPNVPTDLGDELDGGSVCCLMVSLEC